MTVGSQKGARTESARIQFPIGKSKKKQLLSGYRLRKHDDVGLPLEGSQFSDVLSRRCVNEGLRGSLPP
jgi:hypothetical protein